MSIKTRVASWFLKAAEIGGVNITRWMSGRPYTPDTSYYGLVKKYNSWVYACTRTNAYACSVVPLRLYVRKASKANIKDYKTRRLNPNEIKWLGKSPENHINKAMEVEEVLEHPFLELMNTVNAHMNQFDLFESLFSFQDLLGNSFWLVGKTGLTGVPETIWPLLPQYMQVIVDKQKFISSYKYMVDSTSPVFFEPEEIIHFKSFNPNNMVYGMGPLQAAVIAADLGVSMNTLETATFRNRGIPDYVVTYPAEASSPSPESQMRMEKEWKKKYGGRQARKLGFLFGGADIKPISMTPKEMSFLKGREASLNEVAAIFGVPLSKLTTKNVNRANAEAGDYSYMKDTILPRLRRAEQKLNERLLPMFSPNLFVAFDNPVPQDKEFRLKEKETNIRTAVTTINEERQRDGLEEVEYGDLPYIPVNLVPIGTVIEEPKPEPKAKKAFPPLGHPTNFINSEFVTELRGYFGRIKADFLKEFDEESDILKYTTKEYADDLVAAAFDRFKYDKDLSTVLTPFITNTSTFGGEAAIGRLVEGGTFDKLNPNVTRALHQHRAGAIVNINSNTAKRIRRRVATSMEAGEALPELRKTIADEFTKLEKYQAVLIARTETIWAWNEGVMRGYQQSGIVKKKEWSATGDERECEFCGAMDGEIVSIEKSYVEKGTEFVGDEGGIIKTEYEEIQHPPLHPQCRCTLLPVI